MVIVASVVDDDDGGDDDDWWLTMTMAYDDDDNVDVIYCCYDCSASYVSELDGIEWRLISAALCRWRRCFVADQL